MGLFYTISAIILVLLDWIVTNYVWITAILLLMLFIIIYLLARGVR